MTLNSETKSILEQNSSVGLQKAFTHLRNELSDYRYIHSCRAANHAAGLAGFAKNKPAPDETALTIWSALLHDITKEKPNPFHYKIMEEFNLPDQMINAPVAILHAYSAPLYLEKLFGIDHPLIASCIRNHTTGKEGMGVPEKIVYAADYLASLPVEKADEMESLPLTDLCLEKAVGSLEFLLEKKMPVHSDSINFYHSLIKPGANPPERE